MDDPFAAYLLWIFAGCILLVLGLAWIGFRR
jgi:hypothetical protein